MGKVSLALFLLMVFSENLFSQGGNPGEVVVPSPSYFSLLKHVRDSLNYLSPSFIPYSKALKNRHIQNPAVRYSLENLKKSRTKDGELNKAINTLVEYAENTNIKYMLEWMRRYFNTVSDKEQAIHLLKEEMLRDSIASTHSTEEVNQYLATLLFFMEQDDNYQWLKEKSRDSVQLTIINASSQPESFWLNTGRSNYHRLSMHSLLGDTLDTWLQIYPKGNIINIQLPENVYQIKRNNLRKLEGLHLLSSLDSVNYDQLVAIDRGVIRRTYWSYYTDITLSFGQGYLSKNWAGGGENSLSFLSDLKYFINYTKNSFIWENSFRYRVGALKSGDNRLSKNEDKLEILSKWGYKAFKHWNYATQFDLNTILFKSYNYPAREVMVASFLTPLYLTLSVGFDYKPSANVSLYFSPIGGKWTYVKDTVNVNPARYGIEKGKKIKSAAGAKIDLTNRYTLFNFMDIDQRLTAFASYYDDPITVDWRLALGFKINYFMKTSINMNALYDKNNSKKVQFKETLSLDVYFRF